MVDRQLRSWISLRKLVENSIDVLHIYPRIWITKIGFVAGFFFFSFFQMLHIHKMCTIHKQKLTGNFSAKLFPIGKHCFFVNHQSSLPKKKRERKMIWGKSFVLQALHRTFHYFANKTFNF